MQTNVFGEKRPETVGEIIDCMQEIDAGNIYVEITFVEDTEPNVIYRGWNAEVRRDLDGEEVLTTCGFKELETLIEAFQSCGVSRDYIEVLDH